MPSRRAEVTLGLVAKGGKRFEKTDILRFLKAQTAEAIADSQPWLPFRVTDATLLYAKDSKGYLEPALILTSDMNPRYNAGMTVAEWKRLVETMAAKLRDQFSQERVYVTFLPAQVAVV